MIDVRGLNVYLSGPMTGRDGWSKEAFDNAEAVLRARGAAHVFNPAKSIEEGHEHAWYMRRTLHALTQTRRDGAPAYDLVALLDGWRGSDGACAERFVALECGMPVHDYAAVVAE